MNLAEEVAGAMRRHDGCRPAWIAVNDDGERDDREEARDAALLASYAAALADAIDMALPRWVERSVARVLTAWRATADPAVADPDADPMVLDQAREAGVRARDEIGPLARRLLETDIDDQRTNPLTILRRAVVFPTEVLRAAGVPRVVRDEFATSHEPDDDYDLCPVSFADIDPALHEPGLVWGAAKAHVHLRRRREEGRR